MATLTIRQLPDPILKRQTRSVERVDARLQKFIEQLIKTMRSHRGCVGLAAPQIGSDLRVAVMDTTGHPKASGRHGLIVLVNPELEVQEGTVLQREGCLSIPDFTANVRRAAAVTVQAFDEFGSAQRLEFDGFDAIVAQHEIDHLDGKLFLDRVVNLKTDVFRRKTYL